MTHRISRRAAAAAIALIVAFGVSVASAARAQDASVATGRFKISDRVEANYSGTWYPGSIYAARDGRFKIMRDGYTSDERWLTSSELRPLAPTRKTATARGDQPSNIPLGRYVCMTITGGFASGTPSGSVLGQIRIVGARTYTAMTRDGAGDEAGFDYDAASGRIVWDGGKLQGFFGRVVESQFSVDNRGTPIIGVVYRVRDGGNLFNLDCRREGA